jgi:hypothetical protein
MPDLLPTATMTSSSPDLFRKRVVSRSSATSILSSLLSSPKTSCSSPDLTSPSEAFSECDFGARSGSPVSPIKTPPRKSCVSFAAAQPKDSPVNVESNISKPDTGVRPSITPRVSSAFNIEPIPARATTETTHVTTSHIVSETDDRPVLGSVFDEFGEDSSSLVFHDYYRVGEPKKLIDDCLKKERQLRISISQEDIDNSYTYQSSGYASEGDEGEDEGEEDDEEDEEDDDDDDEEEDENEDEEEEEETKLDEPTIKAKGTDREFEASHYAKAARATRILKLHLEIPFANGIIPSLGIYTPTRDFIDNFVPGTLDEDQLDIKSPASPVSPHDIDPTYPSDNDDEDSYRSRTLLVSPVRFASRQRPSSPYLSKFNHNQRGKPPSRANSLPWSQKRFGAQLKRTFIKPNYQDHPRHAAIAIVKSIDHKNHHRREKREEWNQQEGMGAEAMAAMARQLTTKQRGLLILSV